MQCYISGVKGRLSMNEKYEKLFRFIVDTDKECSAELLHALKSLKANFDNALTITKKQIQLSTEKNSFDDISQIAESCQQISEISIRIENAIALMEVKPSNKEIVFEGNANIEKKISSRKPIDYADFDVDNMEPHTLDEDFEYKKICGFEINGIRFEVSSWQDALIQLCSYLYNIDGNKMLGFVDDPYFKRRKVSYFMKESVPRRNKIIPGTNLYVWVNNNANTLVRLMRDMLVRYLISPETMTLYLRRDLSSLH
ncbi:hypothetical protein FAEPRAM212_01885 [Faecalibacterium prausnitzii M21/2]|uniref:Uncharacterized protein n=2 Tax=Faecalibacterium prausnitzii TaxID=853 RepID=A8SC69_9FIRM|nr:hypothetical protein FAEPRAM212_01885 [Faecalibacterium prausnitzii M21/2]